MKSNPHSFRRLTTGLTFSLLVFGAGHSASAADKTNTKTGDKAGAAVTTGTRNTAIGSSALTRNKKGKDNTAVGSNALKSNVAGGFNTALGSAALTRSTGSSNVAVGFKALFYNSSGGFNVALGNGSLLQNTSGSNNIALGVDAGAKLTTGHDNICIDHPGIAGDSGIIRLGTAGTHTKTYIAGTIHGDGSGLTGVTATNVSGTISGNQITSASITGTKLAPNLTLGGVTTGNFNLPSTTGSTTGLISQSGEPLLHTFGTYNTFIGNYAGNFTMTGQANTAIGEGALISNTTGSGNTASGRFALNGNTTGNGNSASGDSALTSNTTGSENSANGSEALYSNTTGWQNTACGAQALYSNTTGYFNSASGTHVLYRNTTGEYNTGSGYQSLSQNTTGKENSANGARALYSNTTGNNNTASGAEALSSNTTGNDNIALGAYAGSQLTTGSNNIAIGNPGAAGESNTIWLGNSIHTNTILAGNVGIGGTAMPVSLLHLRSANVNGANVTLTSGALQSAITQKSSSASDTALQFHNQTANGGNQSFSFLNNNTANLMTILANGNVGIGTGTPTKAKFQVEGAATPAYQIGIHAAVSQGGTGISPNQGAGPVSQPSIYASGDIICLTLRAVSDERIKRVEGRSDASSDLATLLGIEITDYTYVDTLAKGTGKQKKVIAQQVEKVFPQAVAKSTDVVPDIYQKAEVKDGWVALATDLRVGERVRLIGEKEEAIHEVLEVREGAFRTAFQPTTEKIFVFGREVKDFHSVDYDAIAMLNISATQELARKLEAKDTQIAELERQLVAKDEAIEARLARLEAVSATSPAAEATASTTRR